MEHSYAYSEATLDSTVCLNLSQANTSYLLLVRLARLFSMASLKSRLKCRGQAFSASLNLAPNVALRLSAVILAGLSLTRVGIGLWNRTLVSVWLVLVALLSSQIIWFFGGKSPFVWHFFSLQFAISFLFLDSLSFCFSTKSMANFLSQQWDNFVNEN